MAANRPDRDVILSARGLSKIYHMGDVEVPALRGADLDIHRGELLAILGPSGSGKSTLLNLLGGLDSATAGTMTFGEHDLASTEEGILTHYRRHHIGFVFQFYNLIPSLTARENVALVTDISRDPMTPEEALQLVGLEDRMDHFPSQLSGGQQQRVAVARAVAKRPELLLCDEPTGALDVATGKVVLEVLDRVNRELGTTVVIITHNQSIGLMADRVLTMADGRIARTTVHERRARPDEIEW